MSDRIIAKFPDPQGMIARVKARLPKNCAVKMSPYCDYVIAQRMQGIPYESIEKWLKERGPEFRISAATIWRNFKATKIKINLPYAEELAEKWGGQIDLDLARELSRQVLVQRQRIDHMVQIEAEKRKSTPTFTNKLIRAEMETLNSLIHSLASMMKSPGDAVSERAAAEARLKKLGEGMEISEEAEKKLVDMILSGAVKVGGDEIPIPIKKG